MKAVLTIILSLLLVNAKAQNEFFISLDPSSGKFTLIKILPHVNWVVPNYFAYNEQEHYYTFCGSEDATHWNLYTIDALTGHVVCAPEFKYVDDISTVSNESIMNIAYSNSDGNIYGILRNNVTKATSFVSLDPQSAQYHVISKLEGLQYYTFERGIFNRDASHFMFMNVDSSHQGHLTILDVANGKIISNLPLPETAAQLTYDDVGERIIALQSIKGAIQLMSLELKDSMVRLLGSPLLVSTCYALMGSFVYDRGAQMYTFVSGDDSKNAFLTTVGVDGKIKYMLPFQHVNNQGDNVLGFQYDSQLNKIFAIHWEPNSEQSSTRGFLIFPNPFALDIKIFLKKSFTNVAVLIISCEGKLISKSLFKDVDQVILNRDGLAAGVYFVEVYGDGIQLGIAKVVAQ